DGNGSHASTLKSPSYTKSVSWQHYPMCQVFGVSRSGYYDRVQHAPSDRKQSDERLKLEIKVAHIRTRET
ncbi:hypothetical protein PSY31_24235, partial [Shigella flexneri]|nr:hypothetical protein [Shigella flexneri]MDD0164968.1 hypothetical protein [Shigella flexneri]